MYECSSDDEIYVDIHDKVSRLNRGVLTLPENNELLVRALEYDDYCLKKLQTQPILSKTCEYGAKLSGIVLDKAFQINVYDTRESLKMIIDSFLFKFKHNNLNDTYNSDDEDVKNDESPICGKVISSDIVHTPIRSNPHVSDPIIESRIQISKYSPTPRPSSASSSRELDFTLLSKYFYGSSLCFSSMEWDIMPLGKQPIQKPNRKRIVKDKSDVPTVNLDTISHTKEEIENCILADRLISKLRESTTDKPLPFWQFILDTDETNGFNNTCYNLYALTLIVAKGHASITNIANKLHIQISNGDDKMKGNSQQILTGWSYDKWKSLKEDTNNTDKLL